MRFSAVMRRQTTSIVLQALEHRFSSVSSARQARNATEMSALLALAPRSWISGSNGTSTSGGGGASPPATSSRRISAAAVIAATSFLPSTTRETMSDSKFSPSSSMHSDNCPFHFDQVPLHALYNDPTFTKTPCEACLAKRLHFLASEDLSVDLSHRSLRVPSRGAAAAALDAPSPVLEGFVIASFGSVQTFKQAVVEFISSRRGGGFTWVVWSQEKGGKLVVVNMPRNASPTTLGMWPVAAFDVTDGTIAAVHVAVETSRASAPHVEHPSWSRASRNRESAVTRQPVQDVAAAVPDELSVVLTQLATFYVNHIDWKNMEQQVVAARSYYDSEERAQKRKERRLELETVATKKALARTSTDEAESVAEGHPSVSVSSKSDTQPPSNMATTADRQQPSPQLAQEEPQQQQRHDEHQQAEEHAAAADDPQHSLSEDGIHTYTYRDGRRTVLNPHTQTTVFYTAEHTATTHADGTTHFLFANGGEVWTDKTGQSYAKDPRQ